MAPPSFTNPVQDTVAKTGEVAVGEDLSFQRKWWVFERAIWSVFLLVILADLLGLLGHGWLAQATKAAPDGSLTLDYERIERASTPSTLTLRFGRSAFRDHEVRVFVSKSVIDSLGAQRISPEPAVSAVGEGGVTYTFPATASPAEVRIQLQPPSPGLDAFRVQIPGATPIDAAVVVVP